MDETMKEHRINSGVRALWWLTLLLATVILVASLPGYGIRAQALSPSEEFSALVQVGKWLGIIFSLSAVLISLALAGLLYWKKANEPMALFLSFYLINYGIMLSGPLEAFFEYWYPDVTYLPLQLQGVFFGLPSFALVLVFPNGQFVPRWTRFLIPLAGVFFVLAYLVLDAQEAIKMNSLRSQILNGILFLLFGLALANQAYRYRKTYTHVERQQTKWVVYGAALLIVLLILVSIPYYYRLN